MDTRWIVRIHLLLGLLWTNNVHSQIPSSMLKKIAKMNSTEFISTMVHKNMNRSESEKDPLEDILFQRQGEVIPYGAELVASRLSTSQNCTPRMFSVDLPKSRDPYVMYFPSCVEAARCGGCCSGENLRCGAKEAEVKTITVMQVRYQLGASFFEFDRMVELPIEVHSRCECQCKVQPFHCKAYHIYSEDECRCKCKDLSALRDCNRPRVWDNQQCSCRCPKREPCPCGETLNPTTCRCDVTGTPPPPTRTFNPCLRKTCSNGYEPRRDGMRCRCELVTNLSHHVVVRQPRSHITDRFPMMRAGSFNRRR